VTKQRPILTVTVNPALDVYTHVHRLSPQIKLRCSAPQVDPGGGGVNVSRAIHELGGSSTAFVALGGATGTQIANLLAAAGIRAQVFAAEGETRTSFTVMEDASGQHFRFVLPGPPQHANSGAMSRAVIDATSPNGIVVLTGSLLPELPDDFYGELVALARIRGALTIVDTHGAALRSAVKFRPDILRLNHIEAAELLGVPIGDPLQQCEALLRRGAAGAVLVSRGEEGTVVASEAGTHWIHPPKVSVRSSVGAGDSFVGAFALRLARGSSILEAATFGAAAAASAVLAEGTGLCRRAETERLADEISVEALVPAA